MLQPVEGGETIAGVGLRPWPEEIVDYALAREDELPQPALVPAETPPEPAPDAAPQVVAT